MLIHPRATITGTELRACRKAANLTQAELAKRAGFARDAVWYWEGKDRVPLRSGAPAAFAKVLGLSENAGFSRLYTRARSWGFHDAGKDQAPEGAQYAHAGGQGLSSFAAWQAWLDARMAAETARLHAKAAQRLASLRVLCGAKTRAGGQCRNKSEPGMRRCKFHGGKSTGPKTPEGKARIGEAQRRRWAAIKARERGNDP